MTITFHKPRGGGVVLVGLLRRLSTQSYITRPCDPVCTKWKWYWKDNGNVWRLYDKDFLERDLQEQLEQAFLEMLEQGRARATCKFTVSENEFNLFLWSTREMYQVNVKTGTKRQVKRRPVKPLSSKKLGTRVLGDPVVKRKTEESCSKSFVSSPWSSMPPNAQYTSVRLDTSSAEFQDVEELFRKTMNHGAVIESIARVQNPLLWEKYCRNKENMMAVALLNQQQVNEKRLFHGTSPENLAFICKNNFDPGLHRNKVEFGEGASFAVNASDGHRHATRQFDLTRFMFLAKVLVGSYTVGHPSYRRPPPKQISSPKSDLYDSCVDNQSSPSIFVVFDADHFYPEYIIKYASVCHTTPASIVNPLFSPASPLRLSPPLTLRRSLSFPALTASSPSGSASRRPIYRSTASNPGGITEQSIYGASPVFNSDLASANPTADLDNLDTASTSSKTDTLSNFSTFTVSNSELASGNPTENSNSFGAASTSIGAVVQSRSSASTLSNSEFCSSNPPGSSNNSDTASTPSRTAAQSIYAALLVSNSKLTSANPSGGSNNPDIASTPTGAAAQSSYLATPVSDSELTNGNATKSLKQLDSASTTIGTATQRSN
ncbi:protein mono-ADP-ribosyltransferase PARP12-like [Oculina patagonica]